MHVFIRSICMHLQIMLHQAKLPSCHFGLLTVQYLLLFWLGKQKNGTLPTLSTLSKCDIDTKMVNVGDTMKLCHCSWARIATYGNKTMMLKKTTSDSTKLCHLCCALCFSKDIAWCISHWTDWCLFRFSCMLSIQCIAFSAHTVSLSFFWPKHWSYKHIKFKWILSSSVKAC